MLCQLIKKKNFLPKSALYKHNTINVNVNPLTKHTQSSSEPEIDSAINYCTCILIQMVI